MRVLLDTSVLVPAFVRGHGQHTQAADLFCRIRQDQWQLLVAAHSLAETYSVMTGAPFYPRISPSEAQAAIRTNLGKARIIALSGEDYFGVIGSLAEAGVPGGAVYDALLFRAAEKAEADRIYTFNAAHFLRFRSQGKPEIVAP